MKDNIQKHHKELGKDFHERILYSSKVDFEQFKMALLEKLDKMNDFKHPYADINFDDENAAMNCLSE